MREKLYGMINIGMLVIALFLFCINDIPVAVGLSGVNLSYIITLILVVVIVNVIKAFRLYFVMSGNGISVTGYMKQYCKTTPISVIIPLKLGELFRIYCYGFQINNYFAGLVFILLDRFFDTLALITIVWVITLMNQLYFNWVVYILLLFMVIVVAVYIIVPRICQYWKKYLLRVPATKQSVQYLTFLSAMERIYDTITEALKGKGAILYALSLLAWLIEVGGALLLEKINVGNADVSMLMDYLSTALGIGDSINLQHFILGIIIILLFTYVILQVVSKAKEH